MTQRLMRILVVQSDAAQRRRLVEGLAGPDRELVGAVDGHDALRWWEDQPFDVILAEAGAPVVSGWELLERLRRGRPDGEGPAVILLAREGSIPEAVRAIKAGAEDYLTQPLRLDRMRAKLDQLERRFGSARAAAPPPPPDLDSLVIGDSEAMRRVKRMIRISARADANVLLYGETGVGKDLAAAAIHQLSHRRTGPFVKVGCALLPASLIESELYGHEEGSFTGADQARRGRFELAEGGTIYLDDVDDIPLEQQAKLLRVIEEKVYERVGGGRPMKANVRVVASSKKNLLTLIGEGKFREDLYYRLDVLRISVPPLRERPQDIPRLTDHLLRRIAGDGPWEIEPLALTRLAEHAWPGNVRELYHVLERLHLMGGGVITAELVEAELQAAAEGTAAPSLAAAARRRGFRAAMDHAEKQLLLSALQAAGGNKTAAAQSLGMKPSTFRDKLAKHGITGSDAS